MMDLSGTVRSESQVFDEIYDRHHRALSSYAIVLMKDLPDEVEDVMQNVYLRVIRNQEKIAQMNDAGARIYLLKIVEHEVWRFRRWKLPLLKRQIPLEEADTLPLSDELNPATKICAEANYQTLVQLIQTMPATYRDILFLHFLSRLTLRQIAEKFDMNYYTVKKRFQRGKALLIEQIERKGVSL